jgi:hypothetical protein
MVSSTLSRSGPGGLDQAASLERDGHGQPGGPGAHGEGVEDDQRLVAEGVAREEGDHAANVPALFLGARPVVGLAGGARALVEGGAHQRQPAADAALGEGVDVGVRALVGLGQVVKAANVVRLQAKAEEVVAVGGDVLGGVAGGAKRAGGGKSVGRAGWHDLQEPLQSAVALADAAQGQLHGAQLDGSRQAA